MSNKTKQTDRILQYMRDFGGISQLDALRDLGCMRLASRISDLKKQGHPIVSETVKGRNRYGEATHYSVYRLAEGE